MFYSRRGHVAFAHYPKTAGTSVQFWFRRSFPDGELLEVENPHLPVAISLERIRKAPPRGWRQLLASRAGERSTPPRVVGVIREPFEMLVSLYEYWRRFEFPVEPDAEFIQTARRGTFAEFLRQAVVEGCIPTYEWFFDVGGPAWDRTRLVDFDGIDAGLAAVARECGISRPPRLERRNAATARRDLTAYRVEAGPLVDEVHRHFRWYYEQGLKLAIGRPAAAAQAA